MRLRPDALLLLLGAASLLEAAPVVDWVATNGDAEFVGATAASSSPVTTDADGDTVAGAFPAITLAVGDTIKLTGSVTITGNTGTIPGNQLRWGLFHSPGVLATGAGGGYAGVWAAAPATGTGDLVTANGSSTNPFSASASTLITSAGDVGGQTPQFGTSLAFSLTITRLSATQVTTAATLTDHADLLIEWPATTAPASPDSFTYNAVAILLGGSMNATTATFANVEVASGSDPHDPASDLTDHLFGIDFNRGDALGAPSQSLFRVISGLVTQENNAASYTKTIGTRQVTISQPAGTKLEFRGANGDSTRAIPGGDTSLSFLVADFVATRAGALDIAITELPAGTYTYRSYHLDTVTGSDLGFAQGSSPSTPNTIEARIGGALQASVQPTALGTRGLGTTFINDAQIPTLAFTFRHDGSSPLTISLTATQTNGADAHLLLNGFELFLTPAP